MSEETYKINYVAVDKASATIDKIEKAIDRLDARVDKSIAKLKSLGSDVSGLAKFTKALASVENALRAIPTLSNGAEGGLKRVGQGNSALTAIDKRVNALKASLAALQAQAGLTQGSLVNVGSGGAGGSGSGGGGNAEPTLRDHAKRFGMSVSRHAAYAAFRAVTNAASSGVSDRRDFYSQAADVASAYRRDLSELAVLKGKNTADDDLVNEDLDFQSKTLLSPEASKTFRLEFGGAVDASLKANGGRNISPETARELEVQAARFSARYNLDPQTGGRMAGLLGVTQRVPDARAGLGIMAETMEQLNIAGVGSVKGLAGMMARLSGGMLGQVNGDSEDGQAGGGGRFASYPAMAARFAASTVNTFGNASVAKTRIIQSDRLLRKFNGKDEEAFLRKVGITPEDDYETAIRKIAPHILGADGDNVLMKAGFGNSTERTAVIEEAKLNDVVARNMADPRMARARNDALAANEAYGNTTVGRQQAAENGEFAATVRAGMQGEALKSARARARADMINAGTIEPRTIVESLTDRLKSLMQSAGGVSGQDLNVDQRVIVNLRKEARKVNLDLDKEYPRLSAMDPDRGFNVGSSMDEAGMQADYQRASSRIEALKMLQRGGAMIQAGAAGLQKEGGGQAAAPPAAAPQVGNGGAGVNPGRR